MSCGRRGVGSPLARGGKRTSSDKGKRKVSDADVIGGKVSARGQIHVVMAEVRSCLNARNKEAFRKTCFGHLLQLPDIQPQMQLVFLMINSLEVESEGRNVLSFRLNDRSVELGMQEFFCITGLRFNEGCRIPSSSKMHSRIFQDAPNLKAIHIHEALKYYSLKHDGGGSLVLKLALLHVVYGLLLNRDKKCKKIDIQYMHLVDDVEAFNKYPWGKVAYEFLVYWTHRARMNVDRHTLESERPSTDICGFYLTLQIFAFEVAHILARHCARRIDTVSFPRICRWTTSVFFKYTILLPFFHSRDVNSVVQFTFSESERDLLTDAGLSAADAMQRCSSVRSTTTFKNTPLHLVDEDDVHEKEVFRFDHRGKEKIEDDVEEVLVIKSFPSSSVRRSRRESAARLGELLKAATETPSFRGSKPTNEMSNQQLADLILDMKGTLMSQNESIKKMSEFITGFSSMLEILVTRQCNLESSVAALRKCYESKTPPTQEPAMEGEASANREPSHPIHEAHVNDGFMSHGKVEGHVKDASEAGEAEVVGDDVVVGMAEDVVGEVSLRVVGELVKEEVNVQAQEEECGQSVTEGRPSIAITLPACDPVETQVHDDISQGYELSDYTAYEPDPCGDENQAGQSSTKNRLFQDDSDRVEPLYLTIAGEPSLKKRKIKGKGKKAKPELMKSLSWERFDPHREYVFDVERSFYNWFKKCREQSDETPIKLPTACKNEAEASWFVELYSATGWLTDEHIDVLLDLLIIYSCQYPEDFCDDWTVVECMASQTLMLESMHDVSERILPYVEGEFPHQGGKPWHDVSVVYGVGNIGNDHWVLYAIRLDEQQVIFYDSLSAGKLQWEDIKVTFANICLNVPRLVEMLDVYRNKAIKPTLKKVWDMVRYEHPPQQRNVHDCGLLCMKSLECLLTGNPFSAIDPFRASLYRRGYCVELFDRSAALT